ncbi:MULTISPECIES: type II toxin-antitoxin system RelE/ParE family toxin [unclassified Campylobacter]|uniref:type II toxin-antitoxin system RelE/ParE family toxin n=1 Tax=unclassified Campylobacter TaxID=2593542 RepID=UPI003D353FD9
MQVEFKEQFISELDTIHTFIAKDSTLRADNFVDEVFNKCLGVANAPMAHRPSKALDKANARDLIYKGYVIPFLIADDKIIILGIYKANEWSEKP